MPIAVAEAAIAAIRFLYAVGKKVADVAVDEQIMADLSLPRPRIPATPAVGRATVIFFFRDTDEGKAVLAKLDDIRAAWESWDQVKEDGPYDDVLLPCYLSSASAMSIASKTLIPIDGGDLAGYLVVKSYLKGARPVNSAFQRILGEVVNQAVDFLDENPGILPVKARIGRILDPVIKGLADIDWAETPVNTTLLRRMMGIAFDALGAVAQVSIHKEGLQKLVTDMTGAIKEAVASNSPADIEDFLDLNGPVLKSLLQTAATTVSQHPDLFFKKGADKQVDWARGLLLPLVTDISTTKGALFSEETLCHLVATTVRSAGGEAETLLEMKGNAKSSALATLLKGVTASVATSVEGSGAFKNIDIDRLLRDVGTQAIEATAQNLSLFLPDDWASNPNKILSVQLVQKTLDAVAGAWKAGQGPLEPEVVSGWLNAVFGAAAGNLSLRASATASGKRQALYQILGSVTSAMSADSAGLLSTGGQTKLLQSALEAFEEHAPVLLDLKSTDFKTNVLWAALQGTLKAASNAAGSGTPLSEKVLLDLTEAAIYGAANAAIASPSSTVEEPTLRAIVAAVLDLWNGRELDLPGAIAKLPAILPKLASLDLNKIPAEVKTLLKAA